MTFPETTIPRTDAKTVPQTSGNDPFDIGNIPDFLRRTPGDTKPAPLPPQGN